MTRIGILGPNGRMGRALAAELATGVAGLVLAGGAGAGDDAAALARGCDVLVDFTTPAGLAAHLKAAREAGTALVVGTTGLRPEDHAAIDAVAETISVLQAANTSLGVNLLAALVRRAAASLGPDWDIEIAELHHRMKVDSPSGTALMLGEAAAAGRATPLVAERGRDGIGEPRAMGAIGFASLRGGTAAGDHLVLFAGDGERLELGHRAESRAIFAKGALRAAAWLAGKPAGRYTMADVLGIEP